MRKLPPKASSVSGNNYTKEKEKEELVPNVLGREQNNLQSHPPPPGFVTKRLLGDVGESGKLSSFDSKACTCNAGKDTDIDPEQPSTPSSLHDKEPKTNDDKKSCHGSAKASVDGLSIKNTEAGTCAETQKARLFQLSRKSNDAKSHTSVSSSETDEDDDAREVKRQKFENKQGSDCNNKPCHASDHVYAKETPKCAFCQCYTITESTGPMLHYVNGRPVKPEEVDHSNVKNFHEKCFEWSCPNVFGFIADSVDWTRRARKAKCSSAQTLPGQHTSTPEGCCDEFWAAEPVCRQWVLCGSDLSTSAMALLDTFASLSGASVTWKWNPNVTHLIASTNEHGTCNRTQKVLMAILNGKWVLTIDWVRASMAARSPVSEDAYEIGQDWYGIADGPKKGRIRAIQKAAKIFSGLSFYFTAQFEPHYRGFLEEVVLAAGGTVLKNVDLAMDASNAKVISIKSAFIVYNEDPPSARSPAELEEVGRKRCEEVGALESKTGFKVIGHMLLLDHIAACGSAAELESNSKTR